MPGPEGGAWSRGGCLVLGVGCLVGGSAAPGGSGPGRGGSAASGGVSEADPPGETATTGMHSCLVVNSFKSEF